ncbi:PilZ domain-containing protein [Polynucleobacter sp. MWH-Svant-W18]|uniref:PilZ domain-containing protein n=1 Tax=Polynucleobacter sp. MWH-Svant-W18 TaxID=1855909 RepID=UPI001BFCD960|nr:PilZ domain-containing protein [Polynucleobacter sp. MWH-Svant-W18]QWD77366.1 PilZ domain-containing protein [Polynucleobacter sp. MWH-Svant-W18]
MKSKPIRTSVRKKTRAVRHPVSFPISVGFSKGIVKDISTTGIYFEIDQSQSVGSDIDFVLDLDTPGGPIQIQCHGTVIRIEEISGRIGIGATINETIFKN